MTKCLEGRGPTIIGLVKLLFTELSTKENAIYKFEWILDEHRQQGEDQAFEKWVEKKAAAKKMATRRTARKKATVAVEPEDSE
ncbi:hypothetical protein JAAARDRAFT_402287 [Jaapia argillacea MUCL 33604]|uniref:Uncharacterized protein n=1 Tax=Jaapia argillacea MUCL 33604 TaxID=933084 RepID=A0A067PEQ7_9AGAM|nr:hypothetical protein JAAARDRAFT_402287 [Jaapia argillacea MUCL 33604]